MNPITWIVRRWHQRQRQLDIDILWPACRNGTADISIAREAFLWHAANEPAWQALSETEFNKIIDGLT